MKRAALRKLLLALEGVEERPHMDRTAFRTRRKIFATLGGDSRLNLVIEPEERREGLLEAFPGAFFGLGGWTKLGYVAVDVAKVDDALLHELVSDAYHDALPRSSSRRARPLAALTPSARSPRAPRRPARDHAGLPDDLPQATRPIVEVALEVIHSLAPSSATEIACAAERPRSRSMMWKLVRFRIDGENVVTLGTFSDHASMFFGRGAALPDPRGILEGKGKSLRYITLRSPEDAKRAPVKTLVKKAFALAGD